MTAETVASISDRLDRLEPNLVFRDTCNVAHAATEKRVTALEDDIRQIANRPPVWASLLIALLTGAVGGLATAVVNLLAK